MNSPTDSRLHPQSAALLEEMGARPGSPSVEAARAGHDAMVKWVCPPGPALAVVEDLHLGVDRVLVRRYVPEGQPTRAIVYLHGGGWVIGSVDSYDAYCRALASVCRAQVFSVDYRLAPEHPFPAGLDDAQQAFAAVRDQGADWGVDPARVLLAGDSAGGHLALGVARRARALGQAGPAGLVLIYPVTDAGLDSASMREFESGFYLSRDLMAWFWQQFLGNDFEAHADSPEVSPLRAPDLGELPPSLVVTAGCDVLRDEGEALSRRIVELGGRSELLRVPGMLHGFIRFGARIDAASTTLAAISERVSVMTA